MHNAEFLVESQYILFIFQAMVQDIAIDFLQ